MSIYMSRLFPRSNSSFKLTNGNALRAEVVRLSEDKFLVDAGLGNTVTCTKDELVGVPNNRTTRFGTKVGYLDRMTDDTVVNKHFMEKIFIDLVAGESLIKERAAARFNDLVGSADIVAGEPRLLLPRRFRQNQAWMELNKRTNTNVKGFIIEKVRGGYLVAIAGFITFQPFRPLRSQRMWNDRFPFTIESFNPRRTGFPKF